MTTQAPVRPADSELDGFTMQELIAKKRDGERHGPEELEFIARAAADGTSPDYQLSAWLMAVVLRGMDGEETAALTRAMAASGERLKMGKLQPAVDKHSTGGVGDGVSIALAPLAAAAGVTVPMMSGRGLGHTGGTLDKLEAIPKFKVELSPRHILDQLRAIRVCMFGQSEDLAPADRRLYALRDATATVGSLPLVVSSILSKKLAEDLKGLVLDVKVGSGAIFHDSKSADELARELVSIGRLLGIKCVAVLTSMEEPLGMAVGNTVEVAQAIQILHGDRRAKDYVEVMLTLGGWMAFLAGRARTPEEGRELVDDKLASGAGLDKFRQLVKHQGGDPKVVDDPFARLPRARHAATVRAPVDGILQRLDARTVGEAARHLGAGREKAGDHVDPSAGILLAKKIGDKCAKGDTLATLYASDQVKLEKAREVYLAAVTLGPASARKPPLIRKVIK